MRQETRLDRYNQKLGEAVSLQASLVSINFRCDDNLAYLIRTAACFGIYTIHVIGSIPSRKELFNSSGSLVDFVDLKGYSNPSDFLAYARKNDYRLVAAELTGQSTSLHDYSFNFDEHTAIILGNETSGVPSEILAHADTVHIPMLGVGFCLNTSQAGTAFVSEYCRQYNISN